MRVGDRSAKTIGAGGVLAAFSGTLARDGYAGYARARSLTPTPRANCGRKRWASQHPAGGQPGRTAARERGADALDMATLRRIRNHYLGALARGEAENRRAQTALADKARTLITRFRRSEDMILRFTSTLPLDALMTASVCMPIQNSARSGPPRVEPFDPLPVQRRGVS